MTAEISVGAGTRGKHDELFKMLIESFPYAFLELFFPDFAEIIVKDSLVAIPPHTIDRLDWSSRYADLVYKAKCKLDGEEVLIHIEGQAQRVANYNWTLFMYNARLMEKYRPTKVFSIVVYGHQAQVEEVDSLQIDSPLFRILDFRFFCVQLSKLDWRKYIASGNPVAAAMVSKMAYSSEERVDVKLAHLKSLMALDLSPEERELIITYFETYLKLTPEEEYILRKGMINEFNQEEVKKMIKIQSSYRLEGIEEGLRQGKKVGLRRGRREGLRQGRVEGRIEGRIVGREEGKEEGMRMGIEVVAMNLIQSNNLPIAEICRVTGLSQEEIEGLREKVRHSN